VAKDTAYFSENMAIILSLLPQYALGRKLQIWLLFRADCEPPSPKDALGDLSIE
jgi:hypothetical protein